MALDAGIPCARARLSLVRFPITLPHEPSLLFANQAMLRALGIRRQRLFCQLAHDSVLCETTSRAKVESVGKFTNTFVGP